MILEDVYFNGILNVFLNVVDTYLWCFYNTAVTFLVI